VKWVTE